MPATAETMPLYALGHPFEFKFVRHYNVDWLFLLGFVIGPGRPGVFKWP
jgi:hypothetical protein